MSHKTFSHSMNFRVSGPLSECLAVKPKYNAKQAPKKGQGHVRHDRRNIAIGDDPWCDEFTETIAPDILIDRDGDEDASSHRLV